MKPLGPASALSTRRRDIFFVCCFAFFAFSSIFSDSFHALNLIHGDGFWARANRWYAEIAGDGFFAAGHGFMRFNTGCSGLVFGPFYLVLVYAFYRGENWIRTPGLLYVGAMMHGVLEFVWWEFTIGPAPEKLLIFWAFNGPYVLVPILLGIRIWRPQPFAIAPLAE